MNKTAIALLGAMTMTMLVLVGVNTSAQVKQGKTRVLQTKYWMRGVNQPHCAALGKLLKEPGPADDKTWEKAAEHASLLNEAGHVLMADGRCPDATWANAAKTLREESASVLTAIEAKNATDARAAFDNMLGACKGCHSAHKQ